MLPIIDGSTRNSLAVTTDGGKKKYAVSYAFHLDTGEVAHKAGAQIQHAAQQGIKEVSRFVRRKYRMMKVKKTLSTLRKSLSRKIKLDLPVDFKSLKSRVMDAVHA